MHISPVCKNVAHENRSILELCDYHILLQQQQAMRLPVWPLIRLTVDKEGQLSSAAWPTKMAVQTHRLPPYIRSLNRPCRVTSQPTINAVFDSIDNASQA